MILDLAEPHFGGPEKMATVLFENVALHAQPIILAAKPGDLCRRVGGEMQGRRCAPIRPPRISPSAPITPVAKHRGCDAQLPCDLRQRPTAARQQGNRLPLELIRKLTTALAHSTPFRSPQSLAKVSTNSGEAHRFTPSLWRMVAPEAILAEAHYGILDHMSRLTVCR